MNERIRNGLTAIGGLLLFVGLPATVARSDSARVAAGASTEARPRAPNVRPPSPPPPVEPLVVRKVKPEEARDINAEVPFSRLPNPAARPFTFAGPAVSLARAVDCLAAAGYYEAGDDSTGQKAVAQVVLNRLRHPAFPKTVCGVVFQGAERQTGCQFTFTCDGALARTPSVAAWERARDVARAALSGTVFRKIGYSTHYHTDWVVPYWSSSLDKVAAVKTHLFFRWAGWWGTPPAFRRIVNADEPIVPQIGRLSVAHQGADGTVLMPGNGLGLLSPATMAAGTARLISPSMGADGLSGVTLMAVEPGATAFILLLDPKKPETYANMAAVFCTGRPRCRILAWTDRAIVPKGFPISETVLSSMAFSYIHDAASGLQRALWNCAKTPRPSRAECMRVRDPAAAPPAPSQAAPPPATKTKPPETVVITAPF